MCISFVAQQMCVNGNFVMRSGIFDESESTVCQCSERAEVQLWGRGGTGPLILNLAIRWRSMVRSMRVK